MTISDKYQCKNCEHEFFVEQRETQRIINELLKKIKCPQCESNRVKRLDDDGDSCSWFAAG